MSKRNFALIGFVAVAVFTAHNASSRGQFSDRWNNRFVTDDPTGSDAKNDTINYSSGQKTQEDGSVVPAPAPSADVQSFGNGTMHCRDSVVKIRTSDDGNAALSSLSIAEVKHTASSSLACTSFAPRMYVAGLSVDKGSVTVKCNNGQLRVVASDCAGTPPPPPPPPGESTPAPAPAPAPADPPPPANGCPAGSSVLTSNCGCCSDGITTYSRTRSGGGKEGMTCYNTNTQFRSCTNGKYHIINSGVCSAVKPISCG